MASSTCRGGALISTHLCQQGLKPPLSRIAKNTLNKTAGSGILTLSGERFRCSFRVGIEVLLAVRYEQRPPSWPHCPSERLGEGVKTSSSGGWTKVRPFFCSQGFQSAPRVYAATPAQPLLWQQSARTDSYFGEAGCSCCKVFKSRWIACSVRIYFRVWAPCRWKRIISTFHSRNPVIVPLEPWPNLTCLRQVQRIDHGRLLGHSPVGSCRSGIGVGQNREPRLGRLALPSQ